MAVFVLDQHKKPLMPCSEKRARLMLDRGRAVVDKLYPFTIRLKDRKAENSEYQPVKLKLDPGSDTTGIAITRTTTDCEVVLVLVELKHRGKVISYNLTSRRALRRARRYRQTRYRSARFLNRTKPKGWLAPSLRHRVESTLSWIHRFLRISPIGSISCELVRFDLQKLQNPEIEGIEYQQGELAGFEVREYLLNKFNRQCVYCDAKNIPLQIEHVVPVSKGGSNRISNLALACEKCNQKKGNQNVKDFLSKDPWRLAQLLKQLKTPLRDASAVNSTRWALVNALRALGFEVELGSGGLTKYNRIRLGIPKTHALDALCVGYVQSVKNWNVPTLHIQCKGRGRYGRTLSDRYGFPRGYLLKSKSVYGFQTGDYVRTSLVVDGRLKSCIARIAVRASGYFTAYARKGSQMSVKHTRCRLVKRADGYLYINQSKTGCSSSSFRGRYPHPVGDL